MKRTLYLVIFVVLVSAVGYLFGKYAIERYESIGVVAFDMDLPEYKRGYELVSNVDTLQRFLAPSENTSAGARFLLANAVGRDPLRRMISPVYRATRADVRDLGDFRDATKTKERPIIGLRIAVAHQDPSVAQESVVLLADLVRQSLAKDAITRYVADRRALDAETVQRDEADLARNRFDISQGHSKIAELKEVVKSYPQSAALDGRQVVDVSKGTERFLSPISQIVAEEARVIDLRRNEARLQRELRQLKAEQSLTEKLVTRDDATVMRGDLLIDEYKKILHAELGPAARDDDAIRETLANYSADFAEMRGRWIERAQFVAGPSMPREPAGITAIQCALGAGAVALLLAVMSGYRSAFDGVARVLRNAFAVSPPTRS
jgi:hypothetical protein